MNISQKLAWGVCLPNAQRVNGFMVYNSWIPNLICHITLKAYTLFYLHLLWPIPESWSLRGCFLSEIGLWPQPNGEASRGSVMRNISSDGSTQGNVHCKNVSLGYVGDWSFTNFQILSYVGEDIRWNITSCNVHWQHTNWNDSATSRISQ